MEVQQKDKTLDLATSQIEKQFGQGSIMRMGEDSIIKIEGISTGSISLDAHVDSDHNGCVDTRKATSDVAVCFGKHCLKAKSAVESVLLLATGES